MISWISPTALGGATPLSFTSSLANPPSPPVEVIVVLGIIEVAPTTGAGAVTVVLPPFVRGDVNESGSVNLTDAIHLAAAERLPRPVRFVTFDPAQIGAALGLGFNVVSA